MKFKDLKFKVEGDMSNTKRTNVFFENGYGASVIIGEFTYGGKEGLYEMAVLKGTEEDWKLYYDTPITSDVIGYLEPKEVIEYLKQIEELPKVEK